MYLGFILLSISIKTRVFSLYFLSMIFYLCSRFPDLLKAYGAFGCCNSENSSSGEFLIL